MTGTLFRCRRSYHLNAHCVRNRHGATAHSLIASQLAAAIAFGAVLDVLKVPIFAKLQIG
jgi:hypothetical protein